MNRRRGVRLTKVNLKDFLPPRTGVRGLDTKRVAGSLANLTPEELGVLDKAKKKIERVRKETFRLRGLKRAVALRNITLEEVRVAAKAGLIAEERLWWWIDELQKAKRKAKS